jgi:hypothetical protein
VWLQPKGFLQKNNFCASEINYFTAKNCVATASEDRAGQQQQQIA